MNLEHAFEQAAQIARESASTANEALGRDDTRSAKAILTEGQRQLRDLKRQVAAAETNARAQFTEQRNSIAKQGQIVGAFSRSKVRGNLSRARGMQRRSVADRQAEVMAQFRATKAHIDDLVAQLAASKGQLGPTSRATAGGAQPPPPPAAPPAWAPDPYQRHRLRYWDGAGWTEHVVGHDGAQGADPI